MSPRARVLSGLLGALATAVVAVPLASLFKESAWLAPAIAGVFVVAAAGALLRAVAGHTLVTILGQVLVGAWYVLLTQLPETTALGVLPTPETVTRLGEHVADAQKTITTYAAPAPETAGITVMLILVVIVVGLAVDMSAATAGSATVAGLPLLSLFLVSAANSGGALPWVWFLLGASLWLAMVAYQADLDLREWTTSIPMLAHEDVQARAKRSHRWQAARVAAVCIAAAMLVPAVVPHLPTRYVLDGLGGDGAGSAGTTDGIRLSTELDLKRSLESPSQEPVLRYTSDDPSPEPLRVAMVEDFTDGFGRMRSQAPRPQEDFRPPDPLRNVPDDIARERRTLVVDANGVAAPQLPLPMNVSSLDTDGIPWALGRDGVARVQRTPGTYSTTFTELTPEDEDFRQEAPATVDRAAQRDEYLTLDPGSAEEIEELAQRLAPAEGDDLAAAQAIQAYLRGPEFTYDLDIPRPEGGPEDPVLSFLETKTGYCQQFAATMTLLARARDIPARVAVGFLPGDSLDGEERLVRASDAHAWPELYFEGVGWVRFEPTPGTRAANVPSYSIDTDSATTETDIDSATPTSEEPTTTTSEPTPEEDPETEAGTEEAGAPRWLSWLLGALVVLAALAIMPVTALLARRRERRRARDEAARVEHEWRELLEDLEDLGMAPPRGATPRSVGQWLGRRAHLDADVQGQLDHVVSTLERARYAAPGPSLPDVSQEVDSVVREVRSQRMRSTQVRALLWPRAGVAAWRELPGRLGRLFRRR